MTTCLLCKKEIGTPDINLRFGGPSHSFFCSYVHADIFFRYVVRRCSTCLVDELTTPVYRIQVPNGSSRLWCMSPSCRHPG